MTSAQSTRQLFFALFCSSCISTSALAATQIGVIGAADDTVSIKREGGKPVQVKLGDAIYLNDTVLTNAKGKAQLIFEDKSTITVNENSELIIDEFIYNPNLAEGSMSVKGVKGAFRFIGGALSKKKPVKVKTPVATIGIRGGIMDTSIGANGQTNAVFHYGEEMTMTNMQGETSTTSVSGTGFTLPTGTTPVATLPKTAVMNMIGNFTHINSNGGGVAVPPTPNDIGDGLQRLNMDSKQPLPSAGNSLGNTVIQQAAPIVMLDGNSSIVSTQNTRVSQQQGQEAILQTRIDQVQQASENPQQLKNFITNQSITENTIISKPFRERLQPSEGGFSFSFDRQVAPVTTSDTTTTATTDTVTDATVTTTTNTTVAGTNTSASPNPLTETFTLLNPIGGGYRISTDSNSDGRLEVQDNGNIISVMASPNFYKILLESNITAGNQRELIVPKLTNVGVNSVGTTQVLDDGTSVNWILAGYKTKEGSMEMYRILRDGALTGPDAKIDFVIGQNVFDHNTDMFAAYNDAINASIAATMSATPVHGMQTNGVLLYDFLPPVRMGDNPAFGGFNYNRINSAYTDGIPLAQQAPFGMAIDWQSGLNNDLKGTVFSGKVNWLPEGGTSSVNATFARRSGTLGTANDFLLSGKQFIFRTPVSGGISLNNPGNFSYAAVAANGGALYRTANSPIEAVMFDTVRPKETATSVNASNDAGTIFNTIIENDISSKTIQATALKENNITADLAAKINAAPMGGVQQGYSSGVVMQADGTGNYAPVVMSNRNFVNNVQMSRINENQITGNIQIEEYDMSGEFFTGNIAQANFNGQNSAYINNKMYVTQQSTASSQVSGGTSTGNAYGEGVAVSGGIISNGQNAIDPAYHCNDCDFVHWGVWAGKLGQNGNNSGVEDHALMLPYVVGQITNPANLPTTGTATYKGEAYATVFKNDGSTNPQNVAGKMWATANLNGIATQITDFNVYLNNVNGTPLHLKNAEMINVIPTGQATMQGADTPGNGVNLQSGIGAPADVTGRMNGAFYGPTGQEIGGNYIFERHTDEVSGGGIYFGKQRP